MLKTCVTCKEVFDAKQINYVTCSVRCRERHNKEVEKRYHTEYYQNNRETIKVVSSLYNRKNRLRVKVRHQDNPVEYLLRSTKSSARVRKLEFDLELSDIVIPEYCPYLNIKLDKILSGSPYVPSIDRIDSTKGYIKGNIQIISMLANTMKQNVSRKQLLTFAENVIKLHKDDKRCIF